jgi:hypothetical protein
MSSDVRRSWDTVRHLLGAVGKWEDVMAHRADLNTLTSAQRTQLVNLILGIPLPFWNSVDPIPTQI